jgi:hypothetical protein
MAGDVILQAIVEVVLNGPLRKNRFWRRLTWIVLLTVLGVVVALTLGK